MTELEQRIRNLLSFIPDTPERILDTTGTFWYHVAMVRSELKVLEAVRKVEADERA